MATEGSQPLKLSLEASGDLSTAQYLFVKKDANGRAAAVTSATDAAIGVLQNKPKTLGQMAEIVVIGRTKVVAAGVINPNGGVGFDTAGKAVAAAATGTGAAYVQGTKLVAGFLDQAFATAANDVSTAVVNCTNLVAGT